MSTGLLSSFFYQVQVFSKDFVQQKYSTAVLLDKSLRTVLQFLCLIPHPQFSKPVWLFRLRLDTSTDFLYFLNTFAFLSFFVLLRS